jgi:hypothetical protein
MKIDNKPLDEQAVRFEQNEILPDKNAGKTLSREQRLILIGEEMLQNIIDLTNNFIELLNELFADCGTAVNSDEKKQVISDEVFGQALGKKEIQNIWDKDFGRHTKSGRVCKDYGVMLRGKDVLKDYSRLWQNLYKSKGNKSSSGYKSDNSKQLLYGYRNHLLKGLQYFRQMQKNLLKVPAAIKGYQKSQKPSGSNSYGISFGRLENLYFNHQGNKAYIKGGDLYKSLESYFNN